MLDAPEERPALWGTLPLDLDELRDLMGTRQSLLVGVVGTPAAGKTAALVSMYLLVAHGALEGFEFADSCSLTAFEEISQGARVWGATRPEEMTVRTEITTGRVAGFLHIQLKRLSDGKLIDLVLPDLPGEWSDALIDNNRTDRLEFLQAAQVLWVFVNGAELREKTTRMHTLNRTGLLVRRVASMLSGYRPRIKIVVSHSDAGPLQAETAARLAKMIADANLIGDIVDIASFSDIEAIRPGTGIAGLIESSVPEAGDPAEEWPALGSPNAGRFMLRYAQVEVQ